MSGGSWGSGLEIGSGRAERLVGLRASKSRDDAETTFTRENAPWDFPRKLGTGKEVKEKAQEQWFAYPNSQN